MDDLKLALTHADDDFLTAISNKGVVKRAHKDIETASITPGFINDTADVMVDSAQCVIKVPLEESLCSCPSRTICRHIVTAVLWLRQELLPREPAENPPQTPSVSQSPQVFSQQPLEPSPNQSEKPREPSQNFSETQPPPAALSKAERLARELTDYPVESLVKAMKKKYYNDFLEKAKVGVLPKMEELSAITVDIPEDRVTVKLITPLRYASCTCRAAMPCKHTAAAILTWKLCHHVITLDSLLPAEETAVAAKPDQLHSCAAQCLTFLEQLLSDGLVRTPRDAAEDSETYALLCHQAECPSGERAFREIGNRLTAYTNHSPEFSPHELFSSLMDAYRLMTSLLHETDGEKLRTLSGVFKSSYDISDVIELIPLAQRKFSSPTGYEGDIYYFVNKTPQRRELSFLTYSDIRPTFYENGRHSKPSNAPWGLYGLASAVMHFEMRLTLPRLSGIKLSSSSQTDAIQVRKPKLDHPAVYEKIEHDFRRLIEESFTHAADDEEETLVMILPQRCISSTFSEIRQTHTIVVEDAYGQRLKIQARYNSKSRVFFSQLASVGKKMLENPDTPYVIFGNAYLENGECHIYPIAIFDDLHPPRPQVQPRTLKPDPAPQYFSELFREISDMLCDIIQCGLRSFDFVEQISDFGRECERAGLTSLGGRLNKLAEAFAAGNHTLHQDDAPIIRLITGIYTYLQTGIRKTEQQCAINRLYEREEDNHESAR